MESEAQLPCTPEELAQKRRRNEDIVLVDVREADELAIAALPGAVHIPLGALNGRAAELAQWKDSEVIVMCHHGVRSAQGCSILRGHGFRFVRNLSGGIDAYAREVDGSVPRY